jgi:hypothetical protein
MKLRMFHDPAYFKIVFEAVQKLLEEEPDISWS